MRQEMMKHALPAEGAFGDAVMGVGLDKSVLILLKHCRDMKQQETRLRLITLLLVLSCTALFCFTLSVVLMQNTGFTRQRSPDESSPAHSKQVLCPTDNIQTKVQRWHISLRSEPGDDMSDKQFIKWKVLFGEKYNEEKRAIVIRETGVYFVYVKIDLMCHSENQVGNFHVVLQSWNEGYNKTISRTHARDGLECTADVPRTVVVGELLDLLGGDHVSVWIGEGYKLMSKSSFGAFLV